MRLGAYYAVLTPGHQGARGLRRAGRQRAPPPPLRVQQRVPQPLRGRRASCCRARRRTSAWSSSSSSPATRSTSAPRPIRSSRAGPTGPTRCSASSSTRRARAPRGPQPPPHPARAAEPACRRHDPGRGDRRSAASASGRPPVGHLAGGGGRLRVARRRALRPSTSSARRARSAVVPLLFDPEGQASVVLVDQYRPALDRSSRRDPRRHARRRRRGSRS